MGTLIIVDKCEVVFKVNGTFRACFDAYFACDTADAAFLPDSFSRVIAVAGNDHFLRIGNHGDDILRTDFNAFVAGGAFFRDDSGKVDLLSFQWHQTDRH
jgi:hypothetical protein